MNQFLPEKTGLMSVRAWRARDQAPSAPTTRSKSSAGTLSLAKWRRHRFPSSACWTLETLCSQRMVSGRMEERSRCARAFRAISGRWRAPLPLPVSSKTTTPCLLAMIWSSVQSPISSSKPSERPQASRARRPSSACRSSEPDGWLMSDGDGRGRRSKTVKGMELLVRRDASVRPPGPPPRMAILGFGEDILRLRLV